MDKAPGVITAKAKEIASYYTADERAIAETIYGEAGGKPYQDKVGVGWTMRTRKDRYPDLSYQSIANRWYAPLHSLKKANNGELQDWAQSLQAAGEVLNANSNANPIPGVTHFHDPSIEAPDWTKGATQVQYGSGGLLFYEGVKWSK
jgi:spore germination cell wall hydrolase CwlJ-like protein